MRDEPHGTFLERWSRLYTLPRSEIIAARIAVGLVLFLGLAVSFTEFGIRLALAIWLGLVVYVLALVFLLLTSWVLFAIFLVLTLAAVFVRGVRRSTGR